MEDVRVVAVEVLERVSESSATFDAKSLLLRAYSATCCRRVWMRSVSSEGVVGCAGRGGGRGSVACNGIKGGLWEGVNGNVGLGARGWKLNMVLGRCNANFAHRPWFSRIWWLVC